MVALYALVLDLFCGIEDVDGSGGLIMVKMVKCAVTNKMRIDNEVGC